MRLRSPTRFRPYCGWLLPFAVALTVHFAPLRDTTLGTPLCAPNYRNRDAPMSSPCILRPVDTQFTPSDLFARLFRRDAVATTSPPCPSCPFPPPRRLRALRRTDTCAIYAARAQLNPVMFEGMLANGFAAGGQLTTTTDVENFPGFPEGIRGPEMMDLFRAQSLRFGTTIHTETISRVDLSSRPFKLWREGQEQDEPETAETLVIATGASARRMHLPGEETYWQSGISACAVCDGAVPIFRKKPLAVVGGGDSACEEAMYLTKVRPVSLVAASEPGPSLGEWSSESPDSEL